jgi:Mn2+/Fe2+ NRAMP family transporter
VSEAFGLRKGVDLDFRQAPVFRWLFTGMLVVGAVVAMLPHIPVVPLLVAIQVLNGVLLPMILLFLLLLSNDARLMGHLKNGRLANVLGWSAFVFVSLAVLALLATQLLELFGLRVLGGS